MSDEEDNDGGRTGAVGDDDISLPKATVAKLVQGEIKSEFLNTLKCYRNYTDVINLMRSI